MSVQYLWGALGVSLISGQFLDGQIKAHRGKCKDKKLTRPSSIYFSTGSIPPSVMDRIRHGELLNPRSTLWHPYLLIESMTCPSPEHEYDSDSDLEDDEDERSEELKPHDAEGSGEV